VYILVVKYVLSFNRGLGLVFSACRNKGWLGNDVGSIHSAMRKAFYCEIMILIAVWILGGGFKLIGYHKP
ncbi:hypothetical protein, partial [Pseudomonas sp. PA-6-1D]|uniref:hypothetical protein n=1 Tax=Pseudomonas sp. PA-6-1D TaxID=2665481 RepID=UPI001F3B58C2